MRLTWVTDQLQHVLQHTQTGEPPGAWTGPACPSHGLKVGADVDNATLQHLATGQIANLTWEPPPDFTTGHDQLGHAAIQAY